MEKNMLSMEQIVEEFKQLESETDQSNLRDKIAKLEVNIEHLIRNLEPTDSEAVEKLNQLQVNLMNWSQDIEHEQLNRNKTEAIPGKPFNHDNDPSVGFLD
jgi:NifB/MoaA-like Fe-S oxidoreductase